MRAREKESGQVLVLVAFALLALIGSAALILLAGSVEWQRNQLQQLADQAALDSALKIGIGCSGASATTVITEADSFLATQRTRTGSLSIAAGTCATPYTGTDSFSGGLSETIHYPYRAHQQQVEVILTLTLPISFGSQLGQTNTTVVRRAVAQQLAGSTPALSATTLSCTGGQANIAGSIATQNAISLSGSCAVYAHTRFDASSGTYSDLGNVSVYTGGQSWVGGGGTCSAVPTNAICSDGYEVSGPGPISCGTSTAFLSAGDAAVNPNPCAAGRAPVPVPPVSTALPPEPNTDPSAIATLQGTGGSACSAGGSYSPIVAGGVTFGTGLAPAPVKDASGFYHFKPSCYGYLNMASLAGGISNRQLGPESAAQTHFVTANMPASLAGTLLVATISAEETPTKFAAPAGWISAAQVDQAGSGRSEVWYYPNNPGGINSITFTINPANINAVAQLSEWSGVAAVAPLDQSGTALNGGSTSAAISTSGATTLANELVITADGFNKGVAGQTFASGAGWTSLASDAPNGFASEYRLDLPAAVASETVTANPATPWSLVIATFKPAGTATGAILDPGFYYFNGSGFAGGGGICLNGGKLMARDVTLEFVNQAGFSSGTCDAGGGTACSGACAFGSTPCSISACPPNAPFDPASSGGFTWFASPCSQAPTGDNSCPGSAWCPAGDRACWNLLIWAPSTTSGQVTIKGTAARHWLLGSIFWPGTCTDTVNGTSTIAGTMECGNLSISAAAGAGTAVGGDYGISTALVEAVLVE